MGGLLGGLLSDDRKEVGGLLGGLSPADLGMMMAGARMMEMSGPSRMPVSFGQVLGGGMVAGLQGYEHGQNSLLKRQDREDEAKYRKAQTDALTYKTDSQRKLDAFIRWKLGGGVGAPPDLMGDEGPAPGGRGGLPQLTTRAGGDFNLPASSADNAPGPMPVPTFGGMPQGGGQGQQPPGPQQGAQNGSPFPFSLNEVAMLKLRGVDLSDIYKLASDPIKLEGGATYQDRATGRREFMPKVGDGMVVGPNGITVAPGYIDAIGGIKGAETRGTEGAKADFTLLPPGYVGTDGRPLGGTVGDYIRAGQQPPPPQRSGPAPSPAGFPRVEPGVQRDRDMESLRIIQGELASERDPNNRAALTREVARLQASVGAVGGRPALQSEAERQQQVGAVTARQGLTGKLNENWITQSFNPVVEAGRSASSITASLDALSNINVQTGWGTEAKAHAASVLTGLGVAPGNVKFFAANAEKFQSVAMDRLLTTLQAQKGPQTEGDAARAQQAFAQLKNTPEANRFITDFARAKANYDARRAQFYQEALPLAQETGDLNEIDRRWRKIQGSIWSDPVLQRYVRKK